jgi:LysR family transcriptional regulator, nitrogen assimilation regulatory protein
MDLRSLRYFVHIADTGSITRAAAQLGIAQPALTRHMQSLEAEFGTPLLERLPRGVRLTSAGRQLLDHARRVLREVDRAHAELKGTSEPGHARVVLGVSPTVGGWLVPGCVERARASAPELSIKVVEGFSPQLFDALAAGKVDVALLTNPQPARALRYTPLVSEPVVVVAARSLAPSRAFFTLSELARTPLLISDGLRSALDEQLGRYQARLNVEVEIDSIEAIRGLLLRGAGYALMPVSALHDDIQAGRLVALPVSDANLHRMLVLAQSAQPGEPAAVEAVAQIVSAEIAHLYEQGMFTVPSPIAARPALQITPPGTPVTKPQRRKSA